MFFHPMDILIFLALGLAMWAQTKVKGNFQQWSNVRASSNMTGADVARYILDQEGLTNVKVEFSKGGTLSDHYDPSAKTVRLSDGVYQGSSISALAVAAHEVGHAIQDDTKYGMLVLRHRLFPLANFGSQLAPMLFIAGFLLNLTNLIGIGILLFSGAVLFQVVTLPVEFDASRRARTKLLQLGLITNQEEKGIGKVLNAAALTYVASTAMAVFQLIKFIMIFRSRR
ncbi:zinc metallopeptidase [Alkalihalobacterium bogoriense]|uniref:zinc metallopeptidase n=1 Tax=Alkalihalobacterium bogoriense TaxID=246272 RepID=UPI00047D5625|nr:zinc metallopeptidase [Alkalihalobacterium bogoriense]